MTGKATRRPAPAPGSPRRDRPCFPARRFWLAVLVQQVQGVGGVVDEVDAVAASRDGEAEQRPGAGRRTGRVQLLDRDLAAVRLDLHQVAVEGVDGEDVAVRRDGHAQRALEGAVPADRQPGAGAAPAQQRVRYGGDPVPEGVGYI